MTSSPMSWPEWVSHDAVSLADLVRAGQLQAREVVGQAALALARVDGDLSAALEIFDDVLEDPAAAGPDPEGYLYGVPMFLKDLGSRLAGRRQESGSALGARHGDHRVVARARQARGDAHPLRGGRRGERGERHDGRLHRPAPQRPRVHPAGAAPRPRRGHADGVADPHERLERRAARRSPPRAAHRTTCWRRNWRSGPRHWARCARLPWPPPPPTRPRRPRQSNDDRQASTERRARQP